jgi:hypothetical protein
MSCAQIAWMRRLLLGNSKMRRESERVSRCIVSGADEERRGQQDQIYLKLPPLCKKVRNWDLRSRRVSHLSGLMFVRCLSVPFCLSPWERVSSIFETIYFTTCIHPAATSVFCLQTPAQQPSHHNIVLCVVSCLLGGVNPAAAAKRCECGNVSMSMSMWICEYVSM